MGGKRHALGALAPGKDPPVHIEKKGGWVPDPLYTRFRERKNLSPTPGIETRLLPCPSRNLKLAIPVPQILY